MKIKHKLFGLTGLAISALLVIVLITEISNLKLIKLEKTLIEVKDLELSLQEMKRIELQFLNSSERRGFPEPFHYGNKTGNSCSGIGTVPHFLQ